MTQYYSYKFINKGKFDKNNKCWILIKGDYVMVNSKLQKQIEGNEYKKLR